MRPTALPLLAVVLGIGMLFTTTTAQAQTSAPTSSTQPKVTLSGDQLRVVSASVNEEGASAAIDGDTGTHWKVSGGWPQEIVLEIPEMHHVTAVRYIHGSRTANYLTKYRIYASEDGVNWVNTSAPGTIKNTALVWEIRLSWPKNARYVKIVYQGSGGGDSALTGEIQVISDMVTPPPPSSPPPVTPPVSEPPPPPTPSEVSTPRCGTPALVTPGGNIFYVATNGSDNVSCEQAKNTGTPRRTIGAALSCLGSGDTLYIRGGEYAEDINTNYLKLPNGKDWEHPTIIAAYPGEEVVLMGRVNLVGAEGAPVEYIVFDGITHDGTNASSPDSLISLTLDVNHVRFSNCEVRNAPDNGLGMWSGGTKSTSPDYNEVINCDIHHNGRGGYSSPGVKSGSYDKAPGTGGGHGLYISGTNNLFDGNKVHHNGEYGFHIYNSGSNTVSDNIVRNNEVYNNNNDVGRYGGHSGAGIIVSSGPRNQVYNNVVHDNHGGGIDAFYRCHDCVVTNNTVHDNGGAGIGILKSNNVTVKDNAVYNNAGGTVIDWDNGASGASITGNVESPTSGKGTDTTQTGLGADCSQTPPPLQSQQPPGSSARASGGIPTQPPLPSSGSGSGSGSSSSGSSSGSGSSGSTGSSVPSQRPPGSTGSSCSLRGVPSKPLVITGTAFYVSPNGSDSVSCEQAKSSGTPMGTINAALGCLGSGDTLYLRGGTYAEDINTRYRSIPSGTSWERPTVIAAYPGEEVVLMGRVNLVGAEGAPVEYIVFDGITHDGTNAGSADSLVSLTLDVNHVRFSNCEVRNAPGNGLGMWSGGTASTSPDYNEVINCDIHHNGRIGYSSPGVKSGSYDKAPGTGGGHGLYIGGTNNLFEGNAVHHNGEYGFHVYASGSNTVSDNIVRNNEVYNNNNDVGRYGGHSGAGIIVSSGPRNQVYNNVVHDNHGGGIDAFYRCHDCVVSNNTIHDNGGIGVGIFESHNVTVKDNAIYGNAGGEVVNWDGGANGAVITGNGESAAGADMAQIGSGSCTSSSESSTPDSSTATDSPGQ